MKKIGLVICYFHINYGSMLQAYATQHIFDKMGLPNDAVYCRNPHMYMSMSRAEYFFHKLTNKALLMDKLKRSRRMLLQKALKTDFYEKQIIRNKKFDEFSKTYFHVSRVYENRIDLMTDAKNYSAFVVGSDQLWSPANIDNDFYTLTFVPDGIPKIAYATSFGTASIPKYQYKRAQAFLSRFDAVSVREESGGKLVRQFTGKDVPVVLDPTLLLERKDWEKFDDQKPMIEGKYIFCYFLGNNRENRKFAKRLKERTGYQIVALLHMDEFIPSDETFADIAPYDAGPKEFVNLIRNAEYVCTDSFHGTVFSVIFGRKFFVFNRYEESDRMSTNTRIDSLLNMLSLEDRRKKGNERIQDCLVENLDFTVACEMLERKRRESMEYLQAAVGKITN